MNNEYYGTVTTPTDDFLAHYGVRGMKWGVRKAMHKGTDRAWAKAYKKANKKLKKLEKRADLKQQQNELEYHRRKVYRSGAGAIGSTLGGAGAISLATSQPYSKVMASSPKRLEYSIRGLTDTGKAVAAGTGVGLAALGLGLGAKETYHAGKVVAAARRTTPKGHAKAVKKRNEWKKEMDKAFRGTPYDRTRKKRNKSRRAQI